MVGYKRNAWYNLRCLLQTYCHLSTNKKKQKKQKTKLSCYSVSWNFFESYGVISYGTQCLEFGQRAWFCIKFGTRPALDRKPSVAYSAKTSIGRVSHYRIKWASSSLRRRHHASHDVTTTVSGWRASFPLAGSLMSSNTYGHRLHQYSIVSMCVCVCAVCV